MESDPIPNPKDPPLPRAPILSEPLNRADAPPKTYPACVVAFFLPTERCHRQAPASAVDDARLRVVIPRARHHGVELRHHPRNLPTLKPPQ